MATLELVITNNNDSAKYFRDFMDMMESQRNIRKNDVLVTVVIMNGGDKEIEDLIPSLSINTKTISIDSDNIAAAYNTAIRESDSDWIMFMGFGDLFSDVYSVSMILNLLPSDELDGMWMQYYDEVLIDRGRSFVNIVSEMDTTIIGKAFRTEYLRESNILFDETVTSDAGRVFIETIISVTKFERFLKLTTKFIPYTHVNDTNYPRISVSDIMNSQFEMNLAIVRNIHNHTENDFYENAVMKTITDAYYITSLENNLIDTRAFTARVAEFYRKHEHIVKKFKEDDLEIVLDQSQNEMMSIIQNAYRLYGYEMYFSTDELSFDDWIKKLSSNKEKTIHVVPTQDKQDRVAVFCGTRNVYECMETAAKSLLEHTKMDRVYFFIEDDAFPHQLPSIIRCVNVSDQKFFPPDGRNYSNAWTYMCMMRAAFAKLMPDEHKVLSLDIDVVINEDISELWDIDMSGYYLAGVPETSRSDQGKDAYINFGVVMMNLDKIRDTGVDDEIISSLNKNRWGCPEQDAFNHFCKPYIFALDPMYNAVRTAHITGETDREKISHYAGIKYWKHFKPFRKYTKTSWDDIRYANTKEGDTP